MASKSDDLVPILLLVGLAGFLLYRRQQVGGVTATTTARAQADTDKIKAVGSAIRDVFTSIVGGATGNDGSYSSGRPTEAALDQVVQAARDWTAAYGGVAGNDGDPYWSE